MHGVVVEEIKINKNHNRILILGGILVYKLIELIAVKRSMNIICVTNNMKKYFCEIYEIEPDKMRILPIFAERELIEKCDWGTPLRAIYSGGYSLGNVSMKRLNLLKILHNFSDGLY